MGWEYSNDPSAGGGKEQRGQSESGIAICVLQNVRWGEKTWVRGAGSVCGDVAVLYSD